MALGQFCSYTILVDGTHIYNVLKSRAVACFPHIIYMHTDYAEYVSVVLFCFKFLMLVYLITSVHHAYDLYVYSLYRLVIFN